MSVGVENTREEELYLFFHRDHGNITSDRSVSEGKLTEAGPFYVSTIAGTLVTKNFVDEEPASNAELSSETSQLGRNIKRGRGDHEEGQVMNR